MVHGKNRIPYWIDRRLSGLAGPEYHAIISIGLPIEPEDSQYGESWIGYPFSRESRGRGSGMTSHTDYGLPPKWSEYLAERGVPPYVARARGYRYFRAGKPIDGDYAAVWGFGPKYSGLLIPLHGLLAPEPPPSSFASTTRRTSPMARESPGDS